MTPILIKETKSLTCGVTTSSYQTNIVKEKEIKTQKKEEGSQTHHENSDATDEDKDGLQIRISVILLKLKFE